MVRLRLDRGKAFRTEVHSIDVQTTILSFRGELASVLGTAGLAGVVGVFPTLADAASGPVGQPA